MEQEQLQFMIDCSSWAIREMVEADTDLAYVIAEIVAEIISARCAAPLEPIR